MTDVLIVGSGGREHAFAWKLRQSPRVHTIYVAPGNAGTHRIAHNVPIDVTDLPGLVRLVNERDIDLVIIGPEAPLALGLADALRAEGRAVVGPGGAAARIESSKSFAKGIMRRVGIPTASYRIFDRPDDASGYVDGAVYPLVIKADGLAGGKGVAVCADVMEARSVIDAFMVRRVHGSAGDRLIIEEALTGPEISLLALVDGERVVPLPLAQDHKRLSDGDSGPNTGGMGAYAPVPFLTETERAALTALAIEPVVQALSDMGMPYRGILFAGLMLTPAGPRVLEYNCRCGDPESQVILPLIAGDLLPWLEATASGRLEGTIGIEDRVSVGVVLAAPGYPESTQTGARIEGLDEISPDVIVFHAGTAVNADGEVVTAGGRVLTVVGMGDNFDEASRKAYSAPVSFRGMQRRGDIGWQALPWSNLVRIS